MTVLSISAERMIELQRETLSDAAMQKLAKFIKEGWLGHERSVPPDVKPFFPFRDELVLEYDVILKGQKAVVPKSLQSSYIAILHTGHRVRTAPNSLPAMWSVGQRCDKTSRLLFLHG